MSQQMEGGIVNCNYPRQVVYDNPSRLYVLYPLTSSTEGRIGYSHINKRAGEGERERGRKSERAGAGLPKTMDGPRTRPTGPAETVYSRWGIVLYSVKFGSSDLMFSPCP